MKKRFSLKNKLIFIFGALITIAAGIEGLFAVRIARKAVTEKIEAHLIDKATDTAEVIDGRISAFFEFLNGIARMPQIRNPSVSMLEKMRLLKNEAMFNSNIRELYLADTKGVVHNLDGSLSSNSTAQWFKATIN